MTIAVSEQASELEESPLLRKEEKPVQHIVNPAFLEVIRLQPEEESNSQDDYFSQTDSQKQR